VPVLRRALASDNPDLRRRAAASCVALGPLVVELVRWMFADLEPLDLFGREGACAALSAVGRGAEDCLAALDRAHQADAPGRHAAGSAAARIRAALAGHAPLPGD